MFATCSGCDGKPCGCQQFIPRELKLLKCSGCKHPKSFHPPIVAGHGDSSKPSASGRTVTDILDEYGGLDWLRPKMLVEEAKKETNAGLKSHSDSSERPHAAKTARIV
jgi:hypothetical protein